MKISPLLFLFCVTQTFVEAAALFTVDLPHPPRADGMVVQPSRGVDHSLGIGDNAWEQSSLPLPALDGGRYSLEYWRGSVVLLNFWASWCAPCQYEIPELATLQEKYGPQGLQVIGIGVDKARPLRNVSRSLDINYPVLVAEGARGADLLKRWGNDRQTVPYNVVIGRGGRIHYAHQGQFDQDLFMEHIYPLLSQP